MSTTLHWWMLFAAISTIYLLPAWGCLAADWIWLDKEEKWGVIGVVICLPMLILWFIYLLLAVLIGIR